MSMDKRLNNPIIVGGMLANCQLDADIAEARMWSFEARDQINSLITG